MRIIHPQLSGNYSRHSRGSKHTEMIVVRGSDSAPWSSLALNVTWWIPSSVAVQRKIPVTDPCPTVGDRVAPLGRPCAKTSTVSSGSSDALTENVNVSLNSTVTTSGASRVGGWLTSPGKSAQSIDTAEIVPDQSVSGARPLSRTRTRYV